MVSRCRTGLPERRRGVLLAGGQPQVAMDRRWVSFLWSYPNMFPLGAPAVRSIVKRLEPLEFDCTAPSRAQSSRQAPKMRSPGRRNDIGE